MLRLYALSYDGWLVNNKFGNGSGLIYGATPAFVWKD